MNNSPETIKDEVVAAVQHHQAMRLVEAMNNGKPLLAEHEERLYRMTLNNVRKDRS